MKKLTLLTMAVALSVITAGSAYAQRITITMVGNGIAGFSGDNGPGRNATVSGPKDVCVDAAHNLYFADKANGRIRKLSAKKGIVTTIAGGGTSTAEGVLATTALLDPNYLCLDAAGNIYVSTGNQVRKIDAGSGTITTIAGSSTAGYGGDGGSAVFGLLNDPQGICIDAVGNLYIADHFNNRIRKITASTGVISTVAGTGAMAYTGDLGMADTARLNGPIAICMNPAGDIFFSDQEPDCPNFDFSVMRKIDAATGIITTIAGPGVSAPATYGLPAIAAELGTITGMCTDGSGNIYCDEMSCSCRKLNMTTDTLELVGGDFYTQGYSDYITSAAANMNVPYGLCIDNAGTVYVADSFNNRIRKLIQLTTTPTFAFSRGQSIDAVAGLSFALDTTLSITDLDAGQAETWTVISAPVHGMLMGFPVVTSSVGPDYLDFPAGTSYMANSSYVGDDSFKVQVSDGLLSDVVTIYVAVSPGSTTSVTNVVTPVVSIYPNPATNVLNINSNSTINNVTFSNLVGQTVYEHFYSSASARVYSSLR